MPAASSSGKLFSKIKKFAWPWGKQASGEFIKKNPAKLRQYPENLSARKPAFRSEQKRIGQLLGPHLFGLTATVTVGAHPQSVIAADINEWELTALRQTVPYAPSRSDAPTSHALRENTVCQAGLVLVL